MNGMSRSAATSPLTGIVGFHADLATQIARGHLRVSATRRSAEFHFTLTLHRIPAATSSRPVSVPERARFSVRYSPQQAPTPSSTAPIPRVAEESIVALAWGSKPGMSPAANPMSTDDVPVPATTLPRPVHHFRGLRSGCSLTPLAALPSPGVRRRHGRCVRLPP